MQKVRSILLDKSHGNQSSPDSRRAHINKPTSSPHEEIERFLAITRPPLKKHPSKKAMPSLAAGSRLDATKEDQYKRVISSLEAEIEHYRRYVSQYGEIAERNKRLEEQMKFILEELEGRDQSCQKCDTTAKKASLYEHDSVDAAQVDLDSLGAIQKYNGSPSTVEGRDIRVSRHQEIECLYEYVENLEDVMRDLLNQTKQMEMEIRKSTKKEINEMEQKMMSYIFGLEERVSEATFRNNQIMRKLDTSRLLHEDGFALSKTKSQLELESKIDSLRISNTLKMSLSGNGHSQVTGMVPRSDSEVSLINIRVSSMEDSAFPQSNAKDLTSSQLQRPNSVSSSCDKCAQYVKIINEYVQKCQKLEQQLDGLKYGRKTLRQSQNKAGSSLFSQDNLSIREAILEVPEEQLSEKTSKEGDIYSKINTIQSHINIIMDSELNSSSGGESKHGVEQAHRLSHSRHGSRTELQAEGRLKLERVREMLVNILQEVQQIVHFCEEDGSNSLVQSLNSRILQQANYISELEEEISRLRLHVEEGKATNQKLQKLIKMQVREEEPGAPYFRPIAEPVSCLDPKGTKSKINHILQSIRKMEEDVLSESRNAPSDA